MIKLLSFPGCTTGYLEYSPNFGFVLNLIKNVLLIASTQLGSLWTLAEGKDKSQARWRISGS